MTKTLTVLVVVVLGALLLRSALTPTEVKAQSPGGGPSVVVLNGNTFVVVDGSYATAYRLNGNDKIVQLDRKSLFGGAIVLPLTPVHP